MPLWWVTSHKALLSVCKMISVFFFSCFPSVDKWTSRSVVSSYLSGEGLPGLLYVKPEHLCSCMILMKVELIYQVFLRRIHLIIQQKKAARVFKHISSCLCDNGPRHRQLYKRCHISLVIRSQIWKWSGTLRVTLLLQIRLRGNAAFITLQEGEIRRCLAVALPASADLINAKTGPSGKKKDLKQKSVSAVSVSPLPFVSPPRQRQPLHVSVNSPRCFCEVHLSRLPLLFVFLLPVLTCSDDVRAWSSRALY